MLDNLKRVPVNQQKRYRPAFTRSVPAAIPEANDNRFVALPRLSFDQKISTPAATSFIKALMDRIGAACGLIALSPIFLILALLVKRDGGTAFYGQVRVGQDGRKFKCWKFRSMGINSAEVLKHLLETNPKARAEWERDFKLKDDPRITKIGAILRKTSLDELPQLWNVLTGEMSLVGPRPVTEAELKNYGDKIADYYAVRPGMTGLWQVSGRNDVTYDERVAMDSHYVHNWSLLNDVTIIFKTAGVMLQKRGAY